MASLLYVLFLIGISYGHSIPDVRFDQILSHQSLYASDVVSPAQSVLPFAAPVSDGLYDANGFCFVLLTSDGILWSSRLQERKTDNLVDVSELLKNPYSDWRKVYDFSSLQRSDDEKILIAKLPNSIAVVSSAAMVEVVMDWTCSALSSIQIRSGEDILPWESVSTLKAGTNDLWVGTGSGLRYVDTTEISPDADGYWHVLPIDEIPGNETIFSLLSVNEWGSVFVSTADVLYELRFPSTPSSEAISDGLYTVRTEWIQGNLDSTVLDMIYDPTVDCVWMAELDALHKKLRDRSWWRAGYYQGASTDNVTALALDGFSVNSDGYVWVGTADRGLMRVAKTVTSDANQQWRADVSSLDSGSMDEWLSWQMYYGPRYIPDGAVKFILSDAENCGHSGNTVVVTESGVTVLTTARWSLTEKAEVMQSFQYPRHDRNGIVAEVSLRNYGDLSSYSYSTEDSDSIWTGQYATAAAMRYALTGDENHRKSAWRTFEALEMLGNITGIPGLVGRSMCSPLERAGLTEHPTSGCGDPEDNTSNWHASDTMEGWVWKGDTSSDTVDGHYFAYGLVLDLVAVTAEEKSRVVNAIDRLTSYIVENDLYYIDVTGEPTKWGRWNPRDLNDDPQYLSERGGNSLEIFGFLALAYSVTGKKIYYQTFQDLARNHGYYENILNQKIDNPYDDNHSDNELSFLAYHTLFYAYRRLADSKDDVDPIMLSQLEEMVSPVLPSIARYYSIGESLSIIFFYFSYALFILVRNERSPLWLAGVAGVAGIPMKRTEIERSVVSLQLYSADMINWGVRNSGRWDCVLQPYYSRDNPTELQMQKIRPPMVIYSECVVLLYNK